MEATAGEDVPPGDGDEGPEVGAAGGRSGGDDDGGGGGGGAPEAPPGDGAPPPPPPPPLRPPTPPPPPIASGGDGGGYGDGSRGGGGGEGDASVEAEAGEPAPVDDGEAPAGGGGAGTEAGDGAAARISARATDADGDVGSEDGPRSEAEAKGEGGGDDGDEEAEAMDVEAEGAMDVDGGGESSDAPRPGGGSPDPAAAVPEVEAAGAVAGATAKSSEEAPPPEATGAGAGSEAEAPPSAAEVDAEAHPPVVRKSTRTKVPTDRLIAAPSPAHRGSIEEPVPSSAHNPARSDPPPPITPPSSSSDPPEEPPSTPEELHDRVVASRDKLFFVAFSPTNDPAIVEEAPAKKGGGKSPKKDGKRDKKNDGGGGKDKGGAAKKEEEQYRWYLVRADLDTCDQLDNAKDCRTTGRYYVEFYTKASYDQGVLLAGHPLENGIPAAKMRPKADSDSRFWIEWHEYHFDDDGAMIVGKAREFLPNGKKAVHERLTDLAEWTKERAEETKAGGGSDSDGPGDVNEEEEEPPTAEYHPDFDRYTAWADVLDLKDPKTMLVGPFDFEDTKPPSLTEADLQQFDDETRQLFAEQHADLYVRDRVPRRRWEQLAEALEGRDIDPPTISLEKKKPKKKERQRLSGGKRMREEAQGPVVGPREVDKRTKEEPRSGPICQVCGLGGLSEPLICFPATSSRPKMFLHATCGENDRDRMVVSKAAMKEEIAAMTEAALGQTRHISSSDGRTYCVLGELKESLDKAFGSWMAGKAPNVASFGAKATVSASPTGVDLSQPLRGLPEADFAEEEIESLPVAYAYHVNDAGGISEENAKIATLDYEVEQKRLRRLANAESGGRKGKSDKGATSKPPRAPTPRLGGHPTYGGRDMGFAPEPAEGFPNGWVKRNLPRSNQERKAHDVYYYSPKLQFKFRSKPEVHRFLEVLKRCRGDEELAMEKFSS